MKASDLKKTSQTIESIYKKISEANSLGDFKIFIPHFIFIEENLKIKLIEDGFKIYKDDWDGIITNCLIIEW